MKGNGDIFDLKEIILMYRPLISFRVRKSLGYWNPDWEDIVAEIFINVIEKIRQRKFRGESSLGTFIYTITSRRIIDYIRQKKKEMKYVPEPSPFPDPNKRVEERERTVLIAQCIKRLKPRYCDILYSYYYGDLTQKEISKIFSISPSRVSQIINRSRHLLRKMLED